MSCSGVTSSKTPKMVVFIPELLPELRSPGLTPGGSELGAPAPTVHRERRRDRDPRVHQVLWVILYRVLPDDHGYADGVPNGVEISNPPPRAAIPVFSDPHADGFWPPVHTTIPRFSCLARPPVSVLMDWSHADPCSHAMR